MASRIKMVTVNVNSVASYPGTPQVDFGFQAIRILVVNQDDTADALISFDGATDHAHVQPNSLAGGAIVLEIPAQYLWLKAGAVAGSGSDNIRVIGERWRQDL